MTAGRLAGRVALVTGGSRGIGRAIALAFAREGAAGIAVNFQSSSDQAQRVVAELAAMGCRASAMQADVANVQAVEAMFVAAEAVFGRIDVLVNNAGLLIRGSVAELRDEDWDRVIDVNLKGAFLCTRAALPLLSRSEAPVIINMTSGGAGMHGQAPGLAHYYAAKAGVLTYTKCLASELAPRVRVNCIAPGFVDTNFGGTEAKTRERVLATTPLGRVGEPDDVASVAVFLASAESAFITGQAFVVDGGRMM